MVLRPLRWLLQGVALALPPLLVLGAIAFYGVNVPFMDHWDLVALFERVAAGRAGFADFWEPNNRVHRMLLPKLGYTLLAFRTGWDVRFEMYLSFVAALGTFGLLWGIARQQRTIPDNDAAVALATTSWLVFSLHHYQLWLCGFQFAWALVNFCVVASVWLLSPTDRPLRWGVRAGLAALCCAGATVSQLHGTVSWAVGLVLLASVRTDRREKRRLVAAWLAAAGVVGGAALWGLEFGDQATGVATRPRLVLLQFLVILGDQAAVPLLASAFVGGVLLAGLSVTLRLALGRHGFAPVAPWLALGLFGVLSAGVIALGRHQPTGYWLRWSTVPMFAWLALVHLVRLATPTQQDGRAGPVSWALLSSAIVISLAEWPTIRGWWCPNMAAGQATLDAIHLLEHPQNHQGLRWLYVHPELLGRRFQSLQKLGLRTASARLDPTRPLPATIVVEPASAGTEARLTITIPAPSANELVEPVLVFIGPTHEPPFRASGLMTRPSRDSETLVWTTSLSKSHWPAGTTPHAWLLDASGPRLRPLVSRDTR